MRILQAFSGCLILALSAVAGNNLVSNPLFLEPDSSTALPAKWELRTPPGMRKMISVTRSTEKGIKGKVVTVSFPQDSTKSNQSWLSQKIAGMPAAKYTASLKSRIKILDSNAEFSSCLLVAFINSSGKWLGYKKLKTLAYRSQKWRNATFIPKDEWLDVKCEFTTPEDTAWILLRLDVTGPALTAKWAEVSLLQADQSVSEVLNHAKMPHQLPVAPQAVSADGVTLHPDWTPAGADMRNSATRQEICLNGLWAYRPDRAEGDWAYAKVPGLLLAVRPFNVLYNNKEGYNLRTPGMRWIYRTVTLPKTTEDNRFFLKFDAIQRLALRVYWNGTPIGDLADAWGGQLEIPSALVRRNQPNELLILALPCKENNETAYAQADSNSHIYEILKPWHDSFMYDVSLLIKPQRPLVENMRLTPDWRNKSLSVTLPAQQGMETLRYDTRIVDKSGKILLDRKNLPVKTSGAQLDCTIPWKNPVLWTPDTPELLNFTLTLRDANGQIIDESLPERFGFREIWRDGKKLYLNGQELRLRPRMSLIYSPLHDVDFLRRGMSFYKDMGFNTMLRLSDMGSLQSSYHGNSAVKLADEMGLFIIAYLPYNLDSGGQFFSRDVMDTNHDLLRYMDERVVERYFNHPSVIAYSGFGTAPSLGKNLSYANQPNRWGIDPINSTEKVEQLKKEKIISEDSTAKRMLASIDFVNAVRKLDPSRPFLSHYDSGAGDGWGVFDYFNWTPPQEWEEWITNWSKHGKTPIGSWEHGNPYPMSFVNHAIPDGDGEPWVTEYAAMFFGENAYDWESAEYRNLIGKLYNRKTKTYGGPHFANRFVNKQEAALQVWASLNTRLYRSWRLLGINMGIEPFGPSSNYIERETAFGLNRKVMADPAQNLKTYGAKADKFVTIGNWPNEATPNRPTSPTGQKPSNLNPYGVALWKNNRPFLGFLAGKVDHPTEHGHIFTPGEKVEKSLGLVYDGFEALDLTVTGHIELDGRTLKNIKQIITFSGPEIRRDPLTFTIPAKAKGTLAHPGKGSITLEFHDGQGKKLGEDLFKFSVLAKATAERKGVVLYDPENRAKELAGFVEKRVQDLNGFSEAKLLIVAPGAFNADIFSAIRKQLPVLVLSQTPQLLEQIGLRAFPARIRKFWPDSSFKVDADLLRDWRGGNVYTLNDSFAAPRPGYNSTSSSTGMVAETVIETPNTGNFTPLMHGGFDMAMTPLLKTALDGHPVIFSQLEFTRNAGIDPAADALLRSLISGMLKTKPTSRTTPAALGNPALLADLGGLAPVSTLPQTGCVLVTEANDPVALKRYIEKGNTAVIMPQNETVYRTLGVNVTHGKVSRFKLDEPGLNAGSRHFRQELDLLLFDGNAVKVQELGKGRMVLVGFDPAKIDSKEKPYLELTRKRQYRVLAQLLTNYGMELRASGDALLEVLQNPPIKINIAENSLALMRPSVPSDKTWLSSQYNDRNWSRFGLEKGNTMLPDAQLRLHLLLTEQVAGHKELLLDAGTFDDYDEIWLNGIRLGGVTPANSTPDSAWKTRRRYPIPDGLLKSGNNLLAIHTWNRNGVSKGWNAQIRGPIRIVNSKKSRELYLGNYRHSDDPYLLHQW
jgi:beta-galactosidase